MNCKTAGYYNYDIVPPLSANAQSPQALLIHWLSQVGNYFAHQLIQGQEPHIRQQRDRFGETVYHVYDPVTKQSAKYSTEEEVKIWLDERFH